jgi:hypothetical protein
MSALTAFAGNDAAAWEGKLRQYDAGATARALPVQLQLTLMALVMGSAAVRLLARSGLRRDEAPGPSGALAARLFHSALSIWCGLGDMVLAGVLATMLADRIAVEQRLEYGLTAERAARVGAVAGAFVVLVRALALTPSQQKIKDDGGRVLHSVYTIQDVLLRYGGLESVQSDPAAAAEVGARLAALAGLQARLEAVNSAPRLLAGELSLADVDLLRPQVREIVDWTEARLRG